MATTYDHKAKLIEDISKSMEKRETEDLKKIYAENDVNKFSDEAFIAIERLLKMRGERLPDRDTTKKREIYHAKVPTICGLGSRGFLVAILIWAPLVTFFTYNFGLDPLINSTLTFKAIGAAAFIVTALVCEKLICWIKG